MKEIWKDIKGYEGLYQVSNFGRIKLRNGKISNGWDRGLGYKRVRLYKNKKAKNFYLHQLVGKYFIENPKNKRFINHIDSNPSNNHYKNLEWCNQKENMNHAKRKGRMKGSPTLVINMQSGIFYESINEAAKVINMKPNSLVCRLMDRTFNNTYFKYA